MEQYQTGIIIEIKYIYQLEQDIKQRYFSLTYKQVDDDGNVLKDDFKEFKCKICGKKLLYQIKKLKIFKQKVGNTYEV